MLRRAWRAHGGAIDQLPRLLCRARALEGESGHGLANTHAVCHIHLVVLLATIPCWGLLAPTSMASTAWAPASPEKSLESRTDLAVNGFLPEYQAGYRNGDDHQGPKREDRIIRKRRTRWAGVVTSLKEEHENSASRIFSNDRDCLAPHVHSRRAKGSVRPCRSESVVGGCVS